MCGGWVWGAGCGGLGVRCGQWGVRAGAQGLTPYFDLIKVWCDWHTGSSFHPLGQGLCAPSWCP